MNEMFGNRGNAKKAYWAVVKNKPRGTTAKIGSLLKKKRKQYFKAHLKEKFLIVKLPV